MLWLILPFVGVKCTGFKGIGLRCLNKGYTVELLLKFPV